MNRKEVVNLKKRIATLERKLGALFVVMLLVSVFSGGALNWASAAATGPTMITYQGRILDTSNVPISDASVNIEIALYDALTGGNCLYSLKNTDADQSTIDCAADEPDGAYSTTLSDALFTVYLGDTSDANINTIPESVFQDNAAVYIDVEIAGDQLSPRKRVVAAPYAVNASYLDGYDWSDQLTMYGDPSGAGVGQGSVYINPTAAGADETILGIADNGTERFRIDKEGDIVINGGTIDLSTQTVDVTLNAAADALNFDSNTLSIDASKNRVGIGNAAPSAKLDVDYDETSTTANTSYYGFRSDVDSTGIFATGAVTTSIYGIYGDAAATGVSTLGTVNTYGGYFVAAGEGTGAATTNAYGLYVNGATGADNNYSGVFMNGNVGIGTAAPGAKLDISSTSTTESALQIDQSAATNTDFSSFDVSYTATGTLSGGPKTLIGAQIASAFSGNRSAQTMELKGGSFSATYLGNTADAAHNNSTLTGVSGTSNIVNGPTASSTDIEYAYGLYGLATNSNTAGAVIVNGIGVYGRSLEAAGSITTGYGGYFQSDSATENIGVYAGVSLADDPSLRLTNDGDAETMDIIVGDTAAAAGVSAHAGSLYLLDTNSTGELWLNRTTGGVEGTTWQQVALTGSGGLILDDAYNNDSGERTIAVDDGAVSWDLTGPHDFIVDSQSPGGDFIIQSGGSEFFNINNNKQITYDPGNLAGGSGFVINATTAAGANSIFDIDVNALVNGQIIDIDSTSNSLSSADFINIIHDTSANAYITTTTIEGSLIDLERNELVNDGSNPTLTIGNAADPQDGAMVSVVSNSSGSGPGNGVVQDIANLIYVRQQAGKSGGSPIYVWNAGGGAGIYIDQDGNAKALDIDVAAASTNNAVNIVNAGTGRGIFVNQTGAASALWLNQASDAIALDIDANTPTTNNAVDIASSSLTTGAGIYVSRTSSGTDFTDTTGGLMEIAQLDTSSTSTGNALHIDNDGAGHSVVIDQDSSAVSGASFGIQLDYDNSATLTAGTNFFGVDSDVNYSGNSGARGIFAYGGDFSATVSPSAGTGAADVYGMRAAATLSASTAIISNNVAGVYATSSAGTTGAALAAVYGVYGATSTGSGTISAAYGGYFTVNNNATLDIGVWAEASDELDPSIRLSNTDATYGDIADLFSGTRAPDANVTAPAGSMYLRDNAGAGELWLNTDGSTAWSQVTAGGGSLTLQGAYDGGNSVTTTDARDIDFVLANTATDSNFDIDIATDSTSTVRISRLPGAGTNNPAQLLLLADLDADLTIADGLKIQAAGVLTDAIDLSDIQITNAINVGANTILGTTALIDFTNFDVDGSGNTDMVGHLAVGSGASVDSNILADINETSTTTSDAFGIDMDLTYSGAQAAATPTFTSADIDLTFSGTKDTLTNLDLVGTDSKVAYTSASSSRAILIGSRGIAEMNGAGTLQTLGTYGDLYGTVGQALLTTGTVQGELVGTYSEARKDGGTLSIGNGMMGSYNVSRVASGTAPAGYGALNASYWTSDTGLAAADLYGSYNLAQFDLDDHTAPVTMTLDNMFGVDNIAYLTGSAEANTITFDDMYGTRSQASVASSVGTVTVTNLYGIQAVAQEIGSASVTNAYAGHFTALGASNNYAIYASTGLVQIEGDATATTPTASTVDGSGDLFVHNDMEIYDGALCVGDGATDDCSDAGMTDGIIYSTAASVTQHDVAEEFESQDTTLAPGELVSVDPNNAEQIIRSDGTVYDERIIGVVSTDPGLTLGWRAETDPNWYAVALVGRTAVNVTSENGLIQIGDWLTTSSTPGMAMKATGPGPVIGKAIEDQSAPNDTIIAFISIGWSSGAQITQDGTAISIKTATVLSETGTADAVTTGYDSNELIFRGSGWDGMSAEDVEIKLMNVVSEATDYRLSVTDTNDAEVAYINFEGDLAISGRLYPSAEGVLQTDKYIYYDTPFWWWGDRMRTNASGWGTGSYDFAEMFPSNDDLQSGHVVVFATDAEHIRKSTDPYSDRIVGVISTEPGFLAGENQVGDYPVALAGRVPVYVNVENGPIEIGDPLTSSSQPGYAMKATEPGRIIGYALEPHTGSSDDDMLIVFVEAGWYDGGPVNSTPGSDNRASGIGSGGGVNFTSITMDGNIYMTANDILNVGEIRGIQDRWSVDEEGAFMTKGSYSVTIESYQGEEVEAHAVLSTKHKLILTGESQLEGGRVEIKFEDYDSEFNDIISTVEDYRVFVTLTDQANGVYVTEKTNSGFKVVELKGGNSDATFDWMVEAYRKDYEPVEEDPEDAEDPEEEQPPEEEPPAEEPPIEELPVEEPPAEEPPAEEPLVEEPPVEEPPVEEPPADEPPIEGPPVEEPPADPPLEP